MTLRTLSKRMMILASMVTLFIGSVYAAPVDPNRALNVAEQFMPSKPTHKKNAKGTPQQVSEIVYTHYMPQSGRPAIYVVNLNGGFALISADDVAHPVLGYNYGKPWPTNVDSIAPSVKGFLDDLAAQMEAASGHPQDAATAAEWRQPNRSPNRAPRRTAADPSLPDSIGPLLTTTWDQGQYYNAMCPVDQNAPFGYDGHVPTGCVATAMAQIIKYWADRDTIRTRGIHSYDSNYGNLRVNYDSTSYDFAHMPNQLTAQSTQQEIDAVAKLMYECGVAVNMGYGTWESGSNDISMRIALNNNFCFNDRTSYILKQSSVFLQWDSLLIAQIQDSLPILYSGIDVNENVGHSFVCDGHKQDGFFHFNFGWSGNGDGWYKTSAIDPGVWEFNSSQSAIINIWPEANNSTLFQCSEGESIIYVKDSFVHVYHSLGLNSYRAAQEETFAAWNTWVFYSSEEGGQLEFDLNKHPEVYNATNKIIVYDGANADSLLHEYNANRNYWNGTLNLDRTPLISTRGALTIICISVDGYEGSDFIVSKYNGCKRASELEVQNNIATTSIYWKENGDAVQWEVEYGPLDFDIGTGHRIVVNTPHIIVDSIPPYKEYDLYVRPICEDEVYGIWSQKATFMVGINNWNNIVTSQPEGYVVESDSNIYISSPEGLAWLGNVVADYQQNGLAGWTVHLTDDIDLYGYTWTSINGFKGIFQGHGHYIKNMYCLQEGGLFGSCYSPLINDVHIRDAHIKGSASIASSLQGSYLPDGMLSTLMNSSATGVVDNGTGDAGGLVTAIINGAIINCWSSCDVYGGCNVGGICGTGQNGLIQNCYTNGTIHGLQSTYFGAIIGYANYIKINKCYALLDTYHPLTYLWPSGLGSECTESQWFLRDNDDWRLINSFYYSFYSGSEELLIHALNNGITELNRGDLKTWVIDSNNNNFPDFGPYFEVKCPNVSNLKLQNIMGNNNEYGVAITWNDADEAISYELKYHQKDSTTEHVVTLNNNPDTLYGLNLRTIYLFSIRANCDSNTFGGWSKEIEFVVDKPYWTDIVTSMPSGYLMDDRGNVTISSEEGLAWLISVVNGLNGEQPNSFSGKKIEIAQDLYMGRYKWTAMNGFLGDFNGKEHVIEGLNILELTDYHGLFGAINGGTYRNIKITNADIRCKQYAGVLFGEVSNASIDNCHLSGNVSAELNAGGMAGRGSNNVVNLCSFSGNIQLDWYYGGGLFGDMFESNIRNSYTRCNVDVYGYGSGGLVGPCYSGVVENCYSLANISCFMYGGTLLGDLYSSSFHSAAKNCYGIGGLSSWATFIEETVAVGGIIGATNGDPTIASCYGNLSPLIGPAEQGFPNISDTALITDNLSLSETITIEQESYTNLLSALNAWVDANNSEGKYRHWVADTANINGGFPIFAEPVTYMVTFKDLDGTILSKQLCEEGTIPSCAKPTRPATAQYTYIFVGWSPEVVTATGEATYVAQYDSVVNQYTITFQNYDGSLLSEALWEYGVVPTYTAIPAKPATAQYTYTFAGWIPEVVAVTGEATYVAEYDSVVNKYLVVFTNDWGTELKRDSVEYGHAAIPPVLEDIPGWDFIGWSESFDYITSDLVVVANYEMAMYYIEFVNWDGTLLSGYSAFYNTIPVYEGEIPTKPATAQYTYSFIGWSPEVVAVTGEATYVAEYDSVVNKYLVVFTNDWGTELKRDSVEYGQAATPPVLEDIPGWDFIGWSESFDYITSDLVVVANYEMAMYYIEFVNWDGTLLSGYSWFYESIPVYEGEIPTKPATAQYTYSFIGWSPEVVAVTGEATYVAEYDSVVNKYLVVFTNDLGTELKRDSVEYGHAAIPPVLEDIPGWDFIGWSESFDYITSDLVVVANYEMAMYYIEFVNWDGTLLSGYSWFYESIPVYEGEIPTKPATAQYTYTFAGWSPEVVAVTGDATYTAMYDSIVNQYTITFLNYDGIELQSAQVEYGLVPEYTGETPVKPETADSTYTFAGWMPEVVAVTEDATYVAIYIAVPKFVPTDINEVDDTIRPQKVIIDNKIYILLGDKLYTIQGHEVK